MINSNQCLESNTHPSETHPTNIREKTLLSSLKGQHCPDPKTRHTQQEKKMDTKIFNKMPANETQQHTQCMLLNIVMMTSRIIPEIKGGPTYTAIKFMCHINKGKTHMIISLDVEKALDKNPTLFHDQNIQQTRDGGELPQFVKGHL